MGPISQDSSSAGMAAAIEANLNATFALLGRAPSTQLHDDDPDLRWYVTPKVPYHSSTTSTSQNFPKRRMSTPGSRNSDNTLPHINSP
jgi:hypothetical protein